ncbi:TolC family protein [Epilithonimonas sp. UC225_85]|uniref:TolC family protein n=1 Tax=Epilithonimonas sp. UC225_85 TaxID=3350167 RepID=UPI0036D23834
MLKKVFCISLLSIGVLGFSQKKWTIQECVDYAIKNNLQVQAQAYNKDVQAKNLEMAKREYLPSVSGTISNNANFGQTLVGTSSIRNDSYYNGANVGASVLVYNNGRLEKTIRKTGFDVDASLQDIETIKNNIALQIAQQYLSVMLNREIKKISESAMENAQKLYDRAKITTDVGTTAQTVLAEATASLAREKQNVKTAQINVDKALFAMAQLLQLQDYKTFDVVDIPVPDELMPQTETVDEVLNIAYGSQPVIKAAETRIKAAEAQTEVVRTNFYPTITASAGIGSFYNNLLNKNTLGYSVDAAGNPVVVTERNFTQQYSDNFGQQLSLSANIPIFNKGITKLQVEQTKINESIAKNNLEQQKFQLKQDIQQAQFNADSNYEIYVAAMEAERSTKLALDFATKSYDAGRSTIYDVTIARNNYANAQGSVAQAKYNYLFSIKVLDFYAGRGISL